MLHEKKLQSVSLNSTASARLDGSNAAVKADFQLANLVVVDPKNPTRQPALEARLSVDAAMENRFSNCARSERTLRRPRKQRTNCKVTGRIDMRDSNAITGNIKLAAMRSTSHVITISSPENQRKSRPRPLPRAPRRLRRAKRRLLRSPKRNRIRSTCPSKTSSWMPTLAAFISANWRSPISKLT